MSWLRLPEGIDKIRDKIFFHSALFDGLFFIFYNDFVIGDFDDFGARDSKLGI